MVAVRGWALFVVALGAAAPARAQDALAEARAAFDRAAFDEAVAAYDAAAAGDDLSREELLALLRGRALARHASRDVAGAESDLVALASLDPDAELGAEAPPSLQRAFARLRGEVHAPLSLEAEASRIPDGFEIRGHAREDVAELVRAVRVWWRDGDAWRSEDGESVRVVAGGTLRWYAEAIGPGGAVVAAVGSRDTPEVARAPAGQVADDDAGTPIAASDDTALHWGVGVGVGVVLAAVAIVLVALFVPRPETGTQPTGPMEVAP